MAQRETFVCIGDLIPEDHELGMPETPLRSRHDEWITTTAIRCSKVFIKLEIPGDYTEIDPRALRDLVVREAQHTAQMWLSVIGFVEGATYLTRISTIEDSAGCIRELGPKPRFGFLGEDLEIENAKEFAGPAAALSITNIHFRGALHDYVTALNFTLDSPFYLYRALDTLRKHFDNDWDKMHQSLGTNRSTTDALLTTHATKIRHGESLDQQVSCSIHTAGITTRQSLLETHCWFSLSRTAKLILTGNCRGLVSMNQIKVLQYGSDLSAEKTLCDIPTWPLRGSACGIDNRYPG